MKFLLINYFLLDLTLDNAYFSVSKVTLFLVNLLIDLGSLNHHYSKYCPRSSVPFLCSLLCLSNHTWYMPGSTGNRYTEAAYPSHVFDDIQVKCCSFIVNIAICQRSVEP